MGELSADDAAAAVLAAAGAVTEQAALLNERVTQRSRALKQAHASGLTWSHLGALMGVSAQRAQYMARQTDPDKRQARRAAASPQPSTPVLMQGTQELF